MFLIMNIIMSVILTLGVLLLQLAHPMAIALTLILQTFMSIILMGSLSLSYWFCYIIYLILFGGVLILFMYMKNFIKWIIRVFTLMNLFMASSFFFSLLLFNPETLTFLNFFSYDKLLTPQSNHLEKDLFLMKIFNYPSTLMTIFLVMYMFFALIVISKFINTSQGPLRQKIT